MGKRFGPWQQVGHLQIWKSKSGRRNSVEDAVTAVDDLATYRSRSVLQQQLVNLPFLNRKATSSVSTY